MLVDIIKMDEPITKQEQMQSTSQFREGNTKNHLFVNNPSANLRHLLGDLRQESIKHFWSYGNFNMMRLIFWLLEQTGSANILMSTYSISPKTIQGILNRRENGTIKEFRIIIDNRVRSISPKPFAMMAANFDYRCTSIHAKVACLWNQDWKISIVSSQNATDNPKIERGAIYTIAEVFNFDKTALDEIFNRSGT